MGEMQRTALISGATRGLGLETARRMGERGVFVVVGSRSPAAGRVAVEAVAEVGDGPGR